MICLLGEFFCIVVPFMEAVGRAGRGGGLRLKTPKFKKMLYCRPGREMNPHLNERGWIDKGWMDTRGTSEHSGRTRIGLRGVV
jgi:hypothetical protein